MKVVHVETGRHLYGGAQQVLYLSGGLIERGIDSTIVCPPGSEVAVAAERLGLPSVTIACAGDLDVGFAFRLRSWMQEEMPDLVHCHSRRGADFFGGRAARMLKIPALVSRRVDSRESGLMSEFRYSPFARIIAISKNVATELQLSGVDTTRVTVIRSAVDSEVLRKHANCGDVRREFKIDSDAVIGVVVAQLIERKGHRSLLQALPEFCRSHPAFRLIIFGRGPLEGELRNLVSNLKLQRVVSFAGFRDDLDQMLGCADLLIHPAAKEGLGVAMLKAAAAGVPVIAFDVAGASEAVVNGETGILLEAGDRHALLQALSELVENPDMRHELGRAGQARMLTEFSIDTMVDHHVALYESTISGAEQ